MSTDAEQLMKRCREAWSNKAGWENLYNDAYELALPQRNTMTKVSRGSVKNSEVYDSTLQQCTVRLAGTLQTSITPPLVHWARIVPGPFISPEEQRAVAVEYDRATAMVFAALKTSNFDSAIGEFFLDLIIGTACMLVLDGGDKMPYQFVPVPISEIALEEGAYNRIGGIFRKYQKPARTLKEMWPDLKMNEALLNILKDQPGKMVDLNEMTCYDAEKDKWSYNVVMGGTNATGAVDIIVKRTYDTNPWIVSRWIKVAGEVFGRGPVINALPDAKTVNMAKRLELQNAALAIPGVWLAKNNGLFNGNSISMKPGSVIPVQSTGGPTGADIAPLRVGGDINFSQIVQRDLHESIKNAMFDRSIPAEGAVRSATEWRVRQADLQEAIGAPLGRLQQELLRPLFNRLLSILSKRGLFDPIDLDGGVADIQITGSLAQAASLRQVEAIQGWAVSSNEMAGKEVWASEVKVEAIPAYLNELFGVAPQLMRSEEEKAQLAAQAAQLMQQQQQAQAQQQAQMQNGRIGTGSGGQGNQG